MNFFDDINIRMLSHRNWTPGFNGKFLAKHGFSPVEIYGNYRRPFDQTMLYRPGMELFVRGANVFLPHGMWYDPETVRIPPLISHLSEEVGPELASYNDWAARGSLLLRGGRHVADIGVIILPSVSAIHWSNLQKIQAFLDAGGKMKLQQWDPKTGEITMLRTGAVVANGHPGHRGAILRDGQPGGTEPFDSSRRTKRGESRAPIWNR